MGRKRLVSSVPRPDRRVVLLAGLTAVAAGSSLAAQECDGSSQPGGTAASVKSFGAVGDGRADDSAAVQAAYDHVAGAGGGQLLFPRGTYRVALRMTSRAVHLRGEGRGISVLRPATPQNPALRALYALASWDAVSIDDLSIRGGEGLAGIGLKHGHDAYVGTDEYIGRTILNRVGFDNLDRCIERRYGNIGLYLNECTFTDANFHIWTRNHNGPPGDPMHGGVLVATRCRFTGFRRAMLFLDSGDTTGGQITFADNVIESGPGFVVYIRAFNGNGGVPGIWFIRNWNETTATGRAIDVEGTRHAAASFLFARDCTAPVIFEDTPLGNIDLGDTQVETRNCALDLLSAARLDARSRLIHHQARQYSGLAPGLCQSISGPLGPRGLRTPWFRMPLPRGRSRAFESAVLQRFDADAAIPFTGSAGLSSEAVRDDAALVGRPASQQITVAEGQNLWPAPGFSAPPGAWLVTCYIYRRVAGDPVTLQLTGSTGMSGLVPLESDDWEMLANISENPGGRVDGLGLWHRQSGRRGVVRIGGLAILAFASRQQAVDFVNSGLFPA